MDAVERIGGFLLESHAFSNAALTLRLDIPAARAAELAQAVARCALTLDAESIGTLQGVTERCQDPKDQVTGTLHIKFIHDEPDLRLETPSVPG